MDPMDQQDYEAPVVEELPVGEGPATVQAGTTQQQTGF
jgi:hypothetical protein